MTTTDRDLLERAAKAAGYTLKWGDVYMVGGDEVDCSDQPYVVSGQPDEADWYWNPLEDDGDEARLEAACNIDIEWHTIGVVAILNDKDLIHNTERFRETFADHGGDKQKARRYAGTRAAAAMGGE